MAGSPKFIPGRDSIRGAITKNLHDGISLRVISRDLLHGNMIIVSYGKTP
jgi:hypothetical protein